ncbi:MAG: class I SAM-dependent methyltransferase [Acidimicrobiales bacterium]
MTAVLELVCGGRHPLAVDDWMAPASADERALLAGLDGPVLDLGCGPGRLVHALAEQGVPALGVDSSPEAVRAALDRGAPALCRSAFDRLPAEGRWRSVLLVDGNIGIGGHPLQLLRRVEELLAPDGVAVVEVDRPGGPTTTTSARIESGARCSVWFPWAFVAADALDALAGGAGLQRVGWQRVGERWMGRLAHAS